MTVNEHDLPLPPIRVAVTPHNDGGGYFVTWRDPVTNAAGGRGAGLHLQAATQLAEDIRDRKVEDLHGAAHNLERNM